MWKKTKHQNYVRLLMPLKGGMDLRKIELSKFDQAVMREIAIAG